MNLSLTTISGYVTIGTIFFAALAAQPGLPKWLMVASVSGGAICAAARITIGHLQHDAPPPTSGQPGQPKN